MKTYRIYIITLLLIFLSNCQLKNARNNHGINFLENREKVLLVSKSNKNDVIKLIGRPHTKSIMLGDDRWIYFERSITRGKLVKLGQNVLKINNILELTFDKYGVLKEKNLFTKEDMNKVKFSTAFTDNNIRSTSFVNKFLSSLKAKMYGNRKQKKN